MLGVGNSFKYVFGSIFSRAFTTLNRRTRRFGYPKKEFNKIPPQSNLRFNLSIFKHLIFFYSIAHVFGAHVCKIVFCYGPSMYPTVRDGDIFCQVVHIGQVLAGLLGLSLQVLGERISVIRKKLKLGDILVLFSPVEPGILLCKRLTALQYDKVENDSFWSGRQNIPSGHVFVRGDNSSFSTDSRSFGPVPSGLVQARIFYRIWPLNRAGRL